MCVDVEPQTIQARDNRLLRKLSRAQSIKQLWCVDIFASIYATAPRLLIRVNRVTVHIPQK